LLRIAVYLQVRIGFKNVESRRWKVTGGGRGWQKVVEVSADASRRWRRLVKLSRWQRIGRR